MASTAHTVQPEPVITAISHPPPAPSSPAVAASTSVGPIAPKPTMKTMPKKSQASSSVVLPAAIAAIGTVAIAGVALLLRKKSSKEQSKSGRKTQRSLSAKAGGSSIKTPRSSSVAKHPSGTPVRRAASTRTRVVNSANQGHSSAQPSPRQAPQVLKADADVTVPTATTAASATASAEETHATEQLQAAPVAKAEPTTNAVESSDASQNTPATPEPVETKQEEQPVEEPAAAVTAAETAQQPVDVTVEPTTGSQPIIEEAPVTERAADVAPPQQPATQQAEPAPQPAVEAEQPQAEAAEPQTEAKQAEHVSAPAAEPEIEHVPSLAAAVTAEVTQQTSAEREAAAETQDQASKVEPAQDAVTAADVTVAETEPAAAAQPAEAAPAPEKSVQAVAQEAVTEAQPEAESQSAAPQETAPESKKPEQPAASSPAEASKAAPVTQEVTAHEPATSAADSDKSAIPNAETTAEQPAATEAQAEAVSGQAEPVVAETPTTSDKVTAEDVAVAPAAPEVAVAETAAADASVDVAPAENAVQPVDAQQQADVATSVSKEVSAVEVPQAAVVNAAESASPAVADEAAAQQANGTELTTDDVSAGDQQAENDQDVAAESADADNNEATAATAVEVQQPLPPGEVSDLIAKLPPAPLDHVPPEDTTVPLTPEEAQCKALLDHGIRLYGSQNKRSGALRPIKQALEQLKECNARPSLIADASGALADIYFSTNHHDEAAAAVKDAMVAAEQAGNFSLAVKLANNLGSVLKKQDKVWDVLALHERTWELAIAQLGMAHPYTQLARTNLVESLETVQRGTDARELLDHSIQMLLEDEQLSIKEVQEAGGDPNATFPRNEQRDDDNTDQDAVEEEAAADASKIKESDLTAPAPGESRPAAKLRLTRSSLIRSYMEKGRMETRAKAFDAAEAEYRKALELCEAVYGKGSPETGSPMYALAGCYRVAGRNMEAVQVFTDLYEMTVKTQGVHSENAVGVSRQLYELYDESGSTAQAAKFACLTLESMQGLIGMKVHPALEPFYNLAMSALDKAGNRTEAEALKKQYLRGLAQLKTVQQGAQRAGSRATGAAGKSKRRR